MSPTTARLRWGILGVAHNNKRLLPAFARSTRAELRAIASRSLERAKAAAATAGIPTAYGSYEQLLDDPAIDAIYNPLPNSLHAEWTMKAAARGKHVLCEKPLAPTAAEAQKVVDFCRARDVRLMDGFAWVHHPRTAQLRQLLDSQRLGEVRRVTGAFTFPMSPLDPTNIRLRPELGGGSLLDVGCYPVYAIRWADALATFRRNHPGVPCLCADVNQLDVDRIEEALGLSAASIDVIAGGPPCQGFSTVGKRDSDEPRNLLWRSFHRIVGQIRPSYVLIEHRAGVQVRRAGLIRSDRAREELRHHLRRGST